MRCEELATSYQSQVRREIVFQAKKVQGRIEPNTVLTAHGVCHASPAAVLQEDLMLAGFEVAVPELLCIRRARQAAPLHGNVLSLREMCLMKNCPIKQPLSVQALTESASSHEFPKTSRCETSIESHPVAVRPPWLSGSDERATSSSTGCTWSASSLR